MWSMVHLESFNLNESNGTSHTLYKSRQDSFEECKKAKTSFVCIPCENFCEGKSLKYKHQTRNVISGGKCFIIICIVMYISSSNMNRTCDQKQKSENTRCRSLRIHIFMCVEMSSSHDLFLGQNISRYFCVCRSTLYREYRAFLIAFVDAHQRQVKVGVC